MMPSLTARGEVAASGGHLRFSLAAGAVGLMFALAMAGLAVATYLTVVHYTHQQIACNGIGDCEYVNSSKYAEVGGVPVALLGAIAYGMMGVLVLAYAVSPAPGVLQALWAIGLASFGFSMYLTGIELWVLDAICLYCVGSASIMTALFAVQSVALWMFRGQKGRS